GLLLRAVPVGWTHDFDGCVDAVAAPQHMKFIAQEARWIGEHRRIWNRKHALRWYYTHELFRRIAANLAQEPILEVGSGPGFLAQYLSGRVIALDLAPSAHINVCADVHALPFANGSVGTVIAIDVLHHLSRPRDALIEIARVLKGAGVLVVIEPWAG